MKQMQNAIKNNMLVVELQENLEVRERIVKGIFIAFAFFAIFYLFLLGSAVLNVVERKSLEAEAHSLSNQIGELELTYLQASNSVDEQLSKGMGFEELSKNFANREYLNRSSLLAKNEI